MRFSFVFALIAAMPLAVAAQVTQSPTNTFPTPLPRVSPQPLANSQDTAQTTASLMRSSGGSLLRASLAAQTDPSAVKASQISFFAVPPVQPKLLKKHDLITIIVSEESQYKSEGDADLKREADLDAKIEQFIKFSLNNASLQNAIGQEIPEIKMDATRNSKNTATVDRSDSLTLRVQAEVIDVKPNNTLVVQARATITTDDEVQSMVLSGTCRAEDITPDNTVLSTQLFDKNVTKMHKGMVRDTTKRGVVWRLLDVLNPF
ncbi:MAG TPA: flagellar basal body L-ring protein FlgH [Tepidisphaeraceae bacterium]|jgi:flagellar L-ring protein precursor FlgH|nr:flagellar basal body L-ring protein FlgH [Tepidisphaeraceae bacterium]